jgi:uncharacterized protein with HEPN domain
MYSEKNLIHILTALECIEKCWIYVSDYENPQDFLWANDQKDLNAVITLFIAIGEESKKIGQNLKDDVSMEINWKNIAGIRDKISHDYRGVDEEILWAIIHYDLHTLKDALVEMVRLINPAQKLLDQFLDTIYYRHLQYLQEVL